jgi:hypothetical protein
MITRLPKQARSPLVPHLQNGYRTTSVISTASSSFGDAVVDVIDKVIDLAPLPQVAALHCRLQHTLSPAQHAPCGDFSSASHFAFDERPCRFR